MTTFLPDILLAVLAVWRLWPCCCQRLPGEGFVGTGKSGIRDESWDEEGRNWFVKSMKAGMG
jgi:hypothetical protein